METKALWKSKTVLFNAAVGILGVLASLGFVPQVHEWVSSHADVVLAGIGALGVGLRLITKGKIVIE